MTFSFLINVVSDWKYSVIKSINIHRYIYIREFLVVPFMGKYSEHPGATRTFPATASIEAAYMS